MLPLVNPRLARTVVPVFFVVAFGIVLIYAYHFPSTSAFLPSIQVPPKSISTAIDATSEPASSASATLEPTTTAIRYKPTPTFAPPPVVDPFPLLATSTADPPPIPKYNVPRSDMHAEYGLDKAPPLFIGFTRQWPILLQAVVSYITAGWPADNIWVVENTGVHDSNKNGKLSLQNPFYLNHTTLGRLGVKVIQTPVLLTFSQLQNFFLHQAYEHDLPYYFYSHQDVLVLSFEDGPDTNGRPGDRPFDFYDEDDKIAAMFPNRVGHPQYYTIYENCLRELNTTLEREERWGFRWFQYDHLTLVNRQAMEAVGGYDTMMPYYASDCDMNGKMIMGNWTTKYRRVGIINDVSTVLNDLEALYRSPHVTPSFTDPNPLTPDDEAKIAAKKAEAEAEAKLNEAKQPAQDTTEAEDDAPVSEEVEYFRVLNQVAVDMGYHKYRDDSRNRNTWQKAQRGGHGEPFYYDAVGFGRAFELLTEAGRAVYREKWGHRDCDIEKTGLKLDDQWRVEKDWEKKPES